MQFYELRDIRSFRILEHKNRNELEPRIKIGLWIEPENLNRPAIRTF
jgi:hypothetical protein